MKRATELQTSDDEKLRKIAGQHEEVLALMATLVSLSLFAMLLAVQ